MGSVNKKKHMITIFISAVVFANVQVQAGTGRKLIKRQTDAWSWGYADATTSENNGLSPRQPFESTTLKQTTTTTETSTKAVVTTPLTSTTTTEKQPTTTPVFCSSSYEPPEKPNYKVPGRRISEAKCYEYVWELKKRKQDKDEAAICKKYKKRKWGGSHGVGGRPTKPGEFPHMGALGWKAVIGTWVFKCGSSLISDKFALTAAHCAKGSPRDPTIAEVDPKILRIGDKNIIDKVGYKSPPKKDAAIARIIVHPQFKAPTQYFDIALIELDEVVTFSRYVQPACLWNSLSISKLGTQAIGTGWGVIESGSLQISPELQAVTVDVLETSLCDQLLKNYHNRNWQGFQEHQLCAGKLAGGVDSCQGDSGGPLQIKMPLPTDVTDSEGSMHFVIGIIPFGVGCAHPNLPGVYTRVSSFIDWIEQNVWPDE
ncbi:transmembrane protease serine 9-like [Amyelois transitella]|uniref:transmembrane protease serine 9-like n=1 Tax=Amyelois transitella TaxID=680683 RepID=UPI00298F522C|nr:transmembrane protease serine 9-like [Amyelois transitella]